MKTRLVDSTSTKVMTDTRIQVAHDIDGQISAHALAAESMNVRAWDLAIATMSTYQHDFNMKLSFKLLLAICTSAQQHTLAVLAPAQCSYAFHTTPYRTTLSTRNIYACLRALSRFFAGALLHEVNSHVTTFPLIHPSLLFSPNIIHFLQNNATQFKLHIHQ